MQGCHTKARFGKASSGQDARLAEMSVTKVCVDVVPLSWDFVTQLKRRSCQQVANWPEVYRFL